MGHNWLPQGGRERIECSGGMALPVRIGEGLRFTNSWMTSSDQVSVERAFVGYFGYIDKIYKVSIWRGDVLKFRSSRIYPPLIMF